MIRYEKGREVPEEQKHGSGSSKYCKKGEVNSLGPVCGP